MASDLRAFSHEILHPLQHGLQQLFQMKMPSYAEDRAKRILPESLFGDGLECNGRSFFLIDVRFRRKVEP
jgi:hypothetical protein